MNFKKELSPSKPLLYSTQLPILRGKIIKIFCMISRAFTLILFGETSPLHAYSKVLSIWECRVHMQVSIHFLETILKQIVIKFRTSVLEARQIVL